VRDADGRAADQYERFGPLVLRRFVKDDGRALLMYTRSADPDADPALSPSVSSVRSEEGDPDRSAQRRVAEGAATRQRRFNELRDEQVLYAIQRQDRTFLPVESHCPLCPTRPGHPPTEIPFPAFEIAVFDNRFPSLERPDGGAEVVVYTDQHDGSFGRLAPERAEALMWVWRQRYEELGARPDVEYVFIFENRGVEVGTTLHHPHGQIYAYPFLPPVPALELAADRRLGGCAICRLLANEAQEGERVVQANGGVVSYVPYAARWPYEVHVVLREHRRSLASCTPDELAELAGGLQAVTRGYDELFARPCPYVMALHQAPTDDRSDGHLHVEFYPPLRTADKLKFAAGSEQGAGTFIMDVMPEASALALREAIAGAA
jgi:UDPglucose--hexose-1-phosphate uridylyltransferase